MGRVSGGRIEAIPRFVAVAPVFVGTRVPVDSLFDYDSRAARNAREVLTQFHIGEAGNRQSQPIDLSRDPRCRPARVSS